MGPLTTMTVTVQTLSICMCPLPASLIASHSPPYADPASRRPRCTQDTVLKTQPWSIHGQGSILTMPVSSRCPDDPDQLAAVRPGKQDHDSIFSLFVGSHYHELLSRWAKCRRYSGHRDRGPRHHTRHGSGLDLAAQKKQETGFYAHTAVGRRTEAFGSSGATPDPSCGCGASGLFAKNRGVEFTVRTTRTFMIKFKHPTRKAAVVIHNSKAQHPVDLDGS